MPNRSYLQDCGEVCTKYCCDLETVRILVCSGFASGGEAQAEAQYFPKLCMSRSSRSCSPVVSPVVVEVCESSFHILGCVFESFLGEQVSRRPADVLFQECEQLICQTSHNRRDKAAGQTEANRDNEAQHDDVGYSIAEVSLGCLCLFECGGHGGVTSAMTVIASRSRPPNASTMGPKEDCALT